MVAKHGKLASNVVRRHSRLDANETMRIETWVSAIGNTPVIRCSEVHPWRRSQFSLICAMFAFNRLCPFSSLWASVDYVLN